MTGELLQREIFEQPDVIEQLIPLVSDKIDLIGQELQGSFDNILIAARGSSKNAANYARYLLGVRNGIPVTLATPSLYTVYKQPPRMDGALVMAISQSGHSPDVISVLQEARTQGRPTIAVTNTADCPLEDVADHTIHICAGEELAIAATKTYTASLLVIAMISEYLHSGKAINPLMKRIPDWMKVTLEKNIQLPAQAVHLAKMDHCFVISRGYEYATAHEVSLKLKELTLTIAEPYSSAEFMHGPVALVRQGSHVISIVPPGPMHDNIHRLIIKLKETGARMLIAAEDSELLRSAYLAMAIPTGIPDWLFPIISVVPGQLLGLGLARAKNLDPDHPAGLNKVTRTW